MKAACFSCSFSLASASEGRERGSSPPPHQFPISHLQYEAGGLKGKSRIKAGRRSALALSRSCTLNEDWHLCAEAAAATTHRLQIRFSLGHRERNGLEDVSSHARKSRSFPPPLPFPPSPTPPPFQVPFAPHCTVLPFYFHRTN
ncbi:hypothetical protein NPIL_460941 [Nephila pilipes]|uniref:Uncharacterized protein n=1 Tax=Nephila pilipes TaxID=299642 RepID=A0A8X6TFF2_NEPPI|nr:hypothetical protein NPIL_460941 [Nephila pilipes]